MIWKTAYDHVPPIGNSYIATYGIDEETQVGFVFSETDGENIYIVFRKNDQEYTKWIKGNEELSHLQWLDEETTIVYEYEIRNVNWKYSESKVLEEMTKDGWRLVAVANYDGGRSLYFERLKQ